MRSILCHAKLYLTFLLLLTQCSLRYEDTIFRRSALIRTLDLIFNFHNRILVDFAESIARSTLQKLVEKAAYIRIVTRRLITSIVYPRLALPSIFANVRQLASSRLRTPLFSPPSLDPGAPFAFQIFFVESSACLREFFAFSIDAYIRSRCQCRERLLLRLLSCARHWSMINKRKNPAQL